MKTMFVGAVMLLACLSGAARADEASAVQAVENLGGKVTRDDKLPGKPADAPKEETVKALTILLLDADTKGLAKGIKQIEIPEEKLVKKVRLVDAAGEPTQLEWPQLKRQLGGMEITDPKREWVVKSVKMALADNKVVECRVLSLRDTGKRPSSSCREVKDRAP